MLNAYGEVASGSVVTQVLLPFFVQFEIRVELQSEYCRYDVDC